MFNSFIFVSFVYLVVKDWCVLGYRASVVEYNYHYSSDYSVADNLLRNAAVHVNIIRYLRNKSDIVVFPEGSLSPISGSKAALIAAPPPSTSPTKFNQKALQLISDAAKSSNLYVVINVPEKYGKHMYSTNLVFRRNGTVAARYRSFNVGGEAVDRPKAEAVHFDTDFGVRFGLISTSDLMFSSPVDELMQQGVRHFVCPSAWISRLPFLTANQMQQSWAWSRDVTLLAAGLNSVASGQSGSGIFRGRKGHLTRTPLSYFLANVPTTMIITSDHQLHHKHSDSFWNEHTTQNFSLRKLSVQSRQQMSKIFARSSSPDVEYVSELSNALRMEGSSFKAYSTELIEPNKNCVLKSMGSGEKWRCRYHQQLCHGRVCCQFNLTVDYMVCGSPCTPETVVPTMNLDDGFYLFRYRMAVFDGVQTLIKHGDTWGAQICSVIPCLDSSIDSCGKKPEPSQYRAQVFTFRGVTTKVWGQTISSVHISGNFTRANNTVMPSLLLGRTSPSLGRFGLLTNDFTLDSQGNKSWTLLLPDEERNLGVAGIFNRLYSQDGMAPTFATAPIIFLSPAAFLAVILSIIRLTYL